MTVEKMKGKHDIVWLYTKMFTLHDKAVAASAEAQYKYPEPGTVYRAIKDYKPNGDVTYRVLYYDNYDSTQEKPYLGFFADSLTFSGEDMQYEFTELSPQNIPDYDLDSEELRQLAKWDKNPTAGIEMLLAAAPPSIPSEQLEQDLTEEELEELSELSSIEDFEDIDGLMESAEYNDENPNFIFAPLTLNMLTSIYKNSPLLAQGLVQYMHWLSLVLDAKTHKTQLDTVQNYTKEKATVNLYDTYKALEYYKKDNEPMYLIQAISNLFTELKNHNDGV